MKRRGQARGGSSIAPCGRRRGQAVVELALGLMTFVSVLLFGLHFAELGWVGAKVHEAAASTMWDATAYRAYRFGRWYGSDREAVPRAQAGAGRYADLDGRAGVDHAAPQLALTRVRGVDTRCSTAGAPSFALDRLAPTFEDSRGIACATSADIDIVRIPDALRERGEVTTRLCSTGRLTSGRCGQLNLLLGDDALNQGTDQLECTLRNCQNTAFYDVTRATFDRSVRRTIGWSSGYTGFPERWVDEFVPQTPTHVTGFYLSFTGEESGFAESLPDGTWETSPMGAVFRPIGPDHITRPYRVAYTQRQACSAGSGYCFLGKFPCP